ncbi:MAG: hypothetical protein ACQCN6_10180 [Candidatus Bathyarchaeia archaeon]
MQAIGIVLLVLSVGLIVAPVGAMACVHRNDLSGLVFPDKVRGLMHGDNSFFLNNNCNPNYILNNLVVPTIVGGVINETSKDFYVDINVTNIFKFPITLKAFSAQMQTPCGQEMATVTIDTPVKIYPCQSKIIQVDGYWTQAGESYVYDHKCSPTLTVCISDIVVDVNGVKVERDTPFPVTIPFSFTCITITD